MIESFLEILTGGQLGIRTWHLLSFGYIAIFSNPKLSPCSSTLYFMLRFTFIGSTSTPFSSYSRYLIFSLCEDDFQQTRDRL